jgi:hypothetical protein
MHGAQGYARVRVAMPELSYRNTLADPKNAELNPDSNKSCSGASHTKITRQGTEVEGQQHGTSSVTREASEVEKQRFMISTSFASRTTLDPSVCCPSTSALRAYAQDDDARATLVVIASLRG